MVKYVPDRTGRFSQRPHYEPKELDRECENIRTNISPAWGRGPGRPSWFFAARSHARQAERLTSFTTMAASRANHAERESRLQPTLKPNQIS
jgi:hypothetical protein